MRIVLLIIGFITGVTAFSQSEADSIINQGVDFNDRGYYEKAIAKYDEVLTKDPKNYRAYYEKAYTYSEWRMYDSCIRICKFILDNFKDDPQNKAVFVTYGSALDDLGQSEEAVKVFNRGLKKFPDFYLLYYNKAITLIKLNKSEEAEKALETVLINNPFHASSHYILGRIMGRARRIQAVLSLFSFLLIEPQGERAVQGLDLLNQLLTQGITKGENGNVTINIDESVIDKKNKHKDDDFSSADFMLSLLGADNKVPDSLGAKTDADRLGYKMQMLIGMIGETKKGEKGFYKNFYVPMFAEMKEKNLVNSACYIVMSSKDDPEISKWLDENKDEVKKFYDWLKAYEWNKNK